MTSTAMVLVVRFACFVAVASSTCFATGARALPAAKEVAERYADAVVEVRVADGTRKPRASQGFYVSSSGILCAVLRGIPVGTAVEISPGSASPRRGVVVAVNDNGLALVQADLGAHTIVTALGLQPEGPSTTSHAHATWRLGLVRDSRGVQAVVGAADHHGTLVPVDVGAPILDQSLAVVAVAIRRRGGGRIDTVDVAPLRALALAARRAASTSSTTTTTTTTTTRSTADEPSGASHE